jgi:hypothetical protein
LLLDPLSEELDELAELDELDEGELLEEELDELEPELLLELLLLLPYPSAYQPPPFRMKLPLTICR